jgi:hypothetical protein
VLKVEYLSSQKFTSHNGILQKLTVAKPFNIFSKFYGNGSFIAVFTRGYLDPV